MFPIFDHIDTLIAADFYEENNQPFLSEAMKLLNRPNLESWLPHVVSNSYCRSKYRSLSGARYISSNFSIVYARTYYKYGSKSKSLNQGYTTWGTMRSTSYSKSNTLRIHSSRSRNVFNS